MQYTVDAPIQHRHTPVCVKGRNGLASMRVLWPCLLQQDVLHQPGDIHIDVA